METIAELNRESILEIAIAELSALRQEALALANQSQIGGVIEAIDFYEDALHEFTNGFQLVEWCSRAIADVTHEVAAAQYGWESPEADAVFDEQEERLSQLLFTLRQTKRSKPEG